MLLEPILVAGIDLIAVAVALRNLARSIDFAHPAAALEHGRIGAQAHRAAEVVMNAANLNVISLHPLRHQSYDRMGGVAELAGIRVIDAAEIAGGFDHRHLHPEANAEIRHLALARELHRADLALAAALTEPSRDQNAIDMFEEGRGILALEDLGLDPVKIDLDLVG